MGPPWEAATTAVGSVDLLQPLGSRPSTNFGLQVLPIRSPLVWRRSLGSRNAAEVIGIKTDRDGRQRSPGREVERHDAMAQFAWTKGYLYGTGKAKVARALARQRILEHIRERQAAHDVARALDRIRKRIPGGLR